MHFVVAYDITQDRSRNKVMSALKDFGIRVQYSVFECDLDAGRMEELRKRLTSLIDGRSDKIYIYPMCSACFFRTESLGLDERVGFGDRL